MKITLSVYVEGMYGNYVADKVLPEYQQQCFEPLKTTDDSLLSLCTGDVLVSSDKAKIVLKTRENAAELLAKELSEMIVNAMKSKDTHNGYEKR